jgi:murein L,D-transpeptidase YcbB/YkuD
MVNMERSRWLSHDYTKAIYSGEHSIIYANLFQGKQACTRIRVVVGKSMNKKTAVFSG